MRHQLTFANVAAALALFFSLAGTSYAVATIEGSDVANESLTGKDLKNDSVSAKDVNGFSAKVTQRPGIAGSGTIAAASEASCKTGETLISGGYEASGNAPIFTPQDAPVDANSWGAEIAVVTPGPGTSISVTAFALCAS